MKPFLVRGSSMWPVLKAGDLVFVDSGKTIRVGDLVLRDLFGRPTIHRYLAERLTKGDRTVIADETEPFETEARVVVAIVPRKRLSQSGRFKYSSLRQGVLTRFQTTLSILQTRTPLRALKLMFLAGLLLNGFLIRFFLYAQRHTDLIASEELPCRS